ncbi:hypothetical protein AVEN_201941-1 [Araneus ventricosus]|uniref:Uncharacterized protein n=1 Tax=Araneus ventricosus TaxID=182803 RepID=A0A4Y2LIB0_ARAVE|nr:hypothetical protein AVEN_57985-1 [Araneus ventricosus]GBN14468.1 hypothetical protein AVEN_201941-1 [Araneus ventricosus]
MAVNLEKSASQSFSLTHETFRPELQYQNTSIADTDSLTYLGVTFDNKLSWRLHVERLSERFTNRLSILKLLADTPYWKIKLFLKNLCTSNSLRDLQTRTALKSWRRVGPSSIPDIPRRDAVAAFRLNIGHDCLAAHLYRFDIFTEPFCLLCDSGEVMKRNHLLRCGALQGLTEVSRYWEARALFWQ